jgi:hypothetical protein
VTAPTIGDLQQLFALLNKHSAYTPRREEGDYWLEESGVMYLRNKAGVSKLWMPREDYDDIVKYNEEQKAGK